jgi:hypothetical protein
VVVPCDFVAVTDAVPYVWLLAPWLDAPLPLTLAYEPLPLADALPTAPIGADPPAIADAETAKMAIAKSVRTDFIFNFL